MNFKTLWEAVWPVVILRVVAYFVVVVLILGYLFSGSSPDTSIIFPLALLVYTAVYAYGGYRAVSKFNFSFPVAIAIGGLIGLVVSLISSPKADYILRVGGEVFGGLLGGFIGATLARIMKK